MEVPSTVQIEVEAKETNTKIWWLALDLAATLFWLYAITKLFIFDMDVYLVSLVSPTFIWILNYKLLFLLGIMLVAILVTRSLLLGFAVAYIGLYPFVILLWKLPKFIWKQQSWLLAFAILNAIIGFVRSFKRGFICVTLFLISSVLILSSSSEYLAYGCSFTVLALTVVAYIIAFVRAFKPSAVFQTYTKVFKRVKTGPFFNVDASVRNLPIEALTEKQIELRNNSLQSVVLYNRACLLVSKKLRDYQRSGANVASYILNLVTLLLFTVLSFALINYALYKVDHALYQFTYSKASFFAFVYYSAGSMFYAANGLVPVEPLSQALQLIQFLFAVLLVVILVTVFFSLRNERYSSELEAVTIEVEREGRIAEETLLNDFNLGSISSAIEALQNAKAGLIGVIIYLTNNIDGR